MDWYTKPQPKVETATFGSELMADRTAMEQIMDLRLTLRYLGIPIKTLTYLFGDNKTVVNNSMFPQSRLHKCHQMLSNHHVREAMTAKDIQSFIFQESSIRQASGYQHVWQMLQAMQFWEGENAELYDKDSICQARLE